MGTNSLDYTLMSRDSEQSGGVGQAPSAHDKINIP